MELSKSNVGGDALKLTASKFIITVVSFVTVMLLSRLLSLEEYGTYAQLLLVTNIMTTLFMLGLPFSINYYLARADTVSERQKFLSVYYTLITTLSIVIGAVLYNTAPMIVDYFENDLLKSLIYFLVIFPWANIVITSIENFLIIYKRAYILIIFRVANSIALLSIIILVKLFNWSFQIYMILFILVEIVFALIVYLIVKKISEGISISFDWYWIKKILVFSLPIGLASVVGIINIELDKLMIGKLLDTESLAIYTNASRELPITIVASSLIAVVLPEIARFLKKDNTKNALELWGNSMVLSYIIICFFSTGLIVFAEDVIVLLYSEKFLSGIAVFRIYCLVLLLRSTYFGMILNAKGATKFIFYSSLASLVINICFNFIFFLLFGIIGPAIATFLSMLLVIIFQLKATSKLIKVSFVKILPWENLFCITLINILLGILFVIIKLFLPLEMIVGSLVESIILGLFWAGIYLLFTYKTIIKLWGKLKGVES
ncbi:lipopolysaccharide biosynthesis protein [Bacillus sp. E(2018)]|uniref:oligosaccharide flippase family protein n=1 Tax=Bacillus sp. E(2018) TaxID=2502239 RepID=UPI0010F64D42|nr:lipopolysaccharide biosynthesis protein [Bacillus sp. E(2018)]